MSRMKTSMSSLVHVSVGVRTAAHAMSSCHPFALCAKIHWNDHGLAGTARQRCTHGVPQSTSVAVAAQARGGSSDATPRWSSDSKMGRRVGRK
eukprot:10130004-Alexandrium_andersonii.AAC.1